MVLAATLSMLRYIARSEDRDFVDRMHSYFTCNILIALAVIVSFKQFGGKPIECLVPDMFSSSWEQYAENYCWAQDTYFVPMDQVVSGMPVESKRERKISYYQWVPFFLLLEAAFFRLPSLLWMYMSGHSGIKITEIVKLSSDPNNIKPDIKMANIKSLALHLQGAFRFHRRLQKKQIKPHRWFFFCNLPYSAFFVTAVYITTKLFYLLNVTLQLLLMNKFLETDRYSWYGFGAFMDLLNGTTWETSGVFPRVSLCDFDVRVMGNVQEHTIQCVLIINIFNEKIFILLWFWFMFLFFLTFWSLIYWLGVSIFPQPSRRFISRHLEMSDMPFDATDIETENEVKRFIDGYLRSDGVFVLRMLTLQSGVIFGTDLTVALWKSFYGIEQLKRSNSVPGIPRAKDLEGAWKKGEGPRGSMGFGDGLKVIPPPGWDLHAPQEGIELRQRKGNGDPEAPSGTTTPERYADLSRPFPPKREERIRLIPPPAPPPDFMRHVALVRGHGYGLDDPNSVRVTTKDQRRKTALDDCSECPILSHQDNPPMIPYAEEEHLITNREEDEHRFPV